MGRYYKCVVLLVLIEIAQICLCANSNIPCIEKERQALLDFKASIANDSPNKISSWKGTHCCQWEGIGCDNVTGHVTKLDLMSSCYKLFWSLQEEHFGNYYLYNLDDEMHCSPVVAPNVSSSLLQLEHLTYLDLSGNNFGGCSIPMFIGSLGSLEYLSLSNSRFRGRIPNSLGNLKNLQFLDLSSNYYFSTYFVWRSLQMDDDTSWMSNLHSLKHLDLSYVLLNHTHNLFQVLNTLPSLLNLSLSGCRVDNSLIPRYALQNMTSLIYIDLSSNELHGPIPESFRNMTSIESLYLSYNNFTSIPSWFSHFDKLTLLDLSNNGLYGQIPHAFTNLSSLVHLNLYHNYLDSGSSLTFNNLKKLVYLNLIDNRLNGPIPEGFQNMTSIETLYLSHYNFTSIPSWFSHFEKLTHLDLSFNGLHGPISDAFQNMTSIESLYLSGNNFTSVPSRFFIFGKLTYLDLSFNGLHGPIPEAFRNLTFIEYLILYENSLTSIPSWLAELKRLVSLDLRLNQLTRMESSLSTIITNMCSLKNLDLSKNKLQGELMGHFELSGCNKYDLEFLNLDDNDINDRLPTWLGQLENLKYLDFGSNFLHGPIPLSIGKLSKLEEVDLSYNLLEGVLSSNIGQLFNLTRLDLSSNKFDGSIPQSLGKLTKLYSLDLSKNSFNGLIPESMGQLVNLTSLDLSSNKFDGSIPQSLGKLVELYCLDLSNNSFNGLIPESLGQLVNLERLDISSNKLDGIMSLENGRHLNLLYLNLSHNQIRGSLPKNIGHTMFSAENLFLGNNHLNGSIPISLCQSQLDNLDLSKNNLSGEIPDCWEDNQRWSEINLSSNKLTGAFPNSFGNLSTLYWLHLNNNNLQGELPTSFRNLKQLLILDLGDNQLSGSIPSSWTRNAFPLLQVLRLRQNMFSGSIPSQLCQLKSLKILDFSRNKLQGSIPRCIGNLEGMTLGKSTSSSVQMQSYNLIADAPQIWSNEFLKDMDALPPTPEVDWPGQVVTEVVKGTELEYTKILELVVNMDLSQNNLVGFIPNEITWLTGLHGLNLSKNHLKGEIPQLIGHMKSLESLDMSHNQLSGTIPNSMSDITSLSDLNLSHNNLSGPIPKDNQFSTFNESTFAHNPYLCGSPLPNNCSNHISHGTSETKRDGDEDAVEKVWFYFVIAIGFTTGLWGVIGTLWFKNNWRHAYFRWVEDVADKIYVAVVVEMAKIKKN